MGTPLLSVSGLSVHYAGIAALTDVSLCVASDSIVCVVGPNGAGKTSLLRTMVGLVTPSAGAITMAGQPLATAPWERLRAGIAMSPENRRLFRGMTVEENLQVGGYTLTPAALKRSLEQVYDLFPVLRERRHQLAGTCSGGEQQMVAIGRALMSEPKVLLLDEPSLGLAPMVIERIFDLIRQLRESRQLAVVLVEQNVHAALAIADEAYVLEKGRVALSGPAAAVRSNSHMKDVYLGV